MTRRPLFSLLFAAAVALAIPLSGCGTAGPWVPKNDPDAFAKSRGAVNVVDSSLSGKIGSEIQQIVRLEDGRLLVSANIRNRKKRIVPIEARVVFKDFQGLSTGDETAWRAYYLDARQSMTFRAESKTPNAESCTVEIRALKSLKP